MRISTILELSTPPPSSLPIGRSRSPRDAPRDSIDDFDPNDIIGHVAQGSPAPSRPPQRPRGGYPDEGFDIDFDSQQSQATRQVPPEQIEALAAMPDDYDEGALLVDRPSISQWGETSAVGDAGFDGVRRYRSHAEDALEAQLDDAALGQDIDQGVAAELGNPPDDLPFDPDAARAFDAGMSKSETDAIYVSGFEQTDLPLVPDTAAYGDVAEPDGLAVDGSYDPYGINQPQPPYANQSAYETNPAPYGTAEPQYDATVMTADLVDPKHGRAASLVDEDLDEADFYAGQGMYPEAMNALHVLHERYPNHPLILAKMHEVQQLEAGGGEIPMPTVPTESVPIEVAADLHTGGTEALDLDEIEEVSDEDFEEVSDADVAAAPVKRKPTVMLEKPVDEGDADTHYDLGLAYKEMGLYDEAIKAFDKVIRAPGREVQCRVMLGMCQREQGNPQEAIHQFKQGLHANPTDRERLSLYYEIGMTYESVGDGGEALYYFEAVTKRDPNFADAGPRADQLRSSVGSATPPDDDL